MKNKIVSFLAVLTFYFSATGDAVINMVLFEIK